MTGAPRGPSVPQLFDLYQMHRSLGRTVKSLHDSTLPEYLAQRQRLLDDYERRNADMERVRSELVCVLDKTFGPGSGDMIRKMMSGE